MLGSWTHRRIGYSAVIYILVLLSAGSLATAREVKVPGPMLDAEAARAFPQEIFDRITEVMIGQARFILPGPKESIPSHPPIIELVEFVKAPSPTHADTYLFAMRYVVSRNAHGIATMSCQVVAVYKDGAYDEPTVMCERLDGGQSEPAM